MSYTIGIILLALAILVSVSLHEAGHMLTAKMFGMKVTQYFVGFGPTLWSFRKGETEYGLKGIPLGGFVKIVGMTPQDDDVEPGDEARAMWKYPVWKRTIVMAAGSVVHFIIAFLIFWGVMANAAQPNPDNLGPNAQTTQQQATIAPFVQVGQCVTVDLKAKTACNGIDGPAYSAGLRTGDRITRVGDTPIDNYAQLVDTIRGLTPSQTVPITYVRDGASTTVAVTPLAAPRAPMSDPDGDVRDVAVIGVGQSFDPALPTTVTYDAIEAFPKAGEQMGTVFTGVVDAIKKFPEKIPGLWTAITGGERDPNGPVSVVGASRIGGELFERDLYTAMFLVIASLNLFVGLFNLLPLLPLDGGHIAIAWFEKARSWVYARFGKKDPGRVDYLKLMPLTYTVILIFGAFTLLTVTADFVNPITIFK
jgi:membrane-associated protease RseP (regulator of RpoE activity)